MDRRQNEALEIGPGNRAASLCNTARSRKEALIDSMLYRQVTRLFYATVVIGHLEAPSLSASKGAHQIRTQRSDLDG